MKTHLSSLASALTFAMAAVHGAESTNYSITPASQSSGGRSTSTHYTLDGSFGAGAAASSPTVQLRGGFSGALFDVKSLELSASDFTVVEGESRQLEARLRLDDDSLTSVPASSVNWSVLSGPVSVDGNGLATAGSVAQDTPASIQGDWQDFTDIMQLQVLNFGGYDYASDNIPDWWQTLHFGAGNPDAAPDMDPDGDGWNNFFEYTAGLIPTDRLSTFTIRVETVPGQPAQRRIIFRPLVDGRTYTVFASTSMSGAWPALIGAPVSDAGDERTVTDTAADPVRKFYRVGIEIP